MPTDTADGSSLVQAHEPSSRLLQLPEAALTAVLQDLDQRSLANTALACTALSHAVPGSMRSIAVSSKSRCGMHNVALISFIRWLDQHSSNHVTQCSIESVPDYLAAHQIVLQHLPCPQLRQLRLWGQKLQLQPAVGGPGVLRHCTGLTALDLGCCLICDAPAVSAAIAVLSELQDLRLEDNSDPQGQYPFAAAQFPTSLTQLNLVYSTPPADVEDDGSMNLMTQQLTQLSALVNLQHLELSELSHIGVPGGLPSQLVKLTCLHVQFWSNGDTAEQFCHLSALTALRELAIKFEEMHSDMPEDHLSGITHLAYLTELELQARKFYVGTEVTNIWSRLTALHSLTLGDCKMQPSALAPLAQLQSLSLSDVYLSDDLMSSHDLLVALAHLTALTQLFCHIHYGIHYGGLLGEPLPPAAAFTALTASTHLRSLDVDLGEDSTPPTLSCFQPVLCIRICALYTCTSSRPARSCCSAWAALALLWRAWVVFCVRPVQPKNASRCCSWQH